MRTWVVLGMLAVWPEPPGARSKKGDNPASGRGPRRARWTRARR